MSRMLKIIGVLAATLVAVVLVALVVVLSISDERYQKWTIDAVESTTGRQLAMNEFSLDLGEVIGVNATGVRFSNAPWASGEDMVRVDRIEVLVRLFDLLRGRPAIEARIDGASIDLQRNAIGEANWRMAGSPDRDHDRGRGEGRGLGAVALVQEISLTDSRIRIDDAVSGSVRTLTVDRLGMRSGETVEVDLAGSAQDVPLSLSGSLGRAEDLAAARSTPVQIAGTAGDSTLDVSGTWNPVGEAPEADIRVAADLPSDAAVVALTGLQPGAVSGGRIQARLVAGDGTYGLPELDIRLDGERITAEVGGSIGRLAPPGDIDLTVDASAGEPAALLRQLGVNITTPLPETVALAGRLGGDGDVIRATDVALTTGEEGFAASASGTIAFTGGDIPDLDVDFEATAPSSEALARYAGQALPELGALSARGKVVSSQSGIGLEQLEVNLGGKGLEAHVKGTVASIAGFRGADLEIDATKGELDAGTADALLKFLAERGVELRPSVLESQLDTSGRLQGGADRLDLRDWSATVRGEGLSIDASGGIEDLLGERKLSVDVNGNVEPVTALARYTGVTVPDLGALGVNGRVVTTETGIGLEMLAADLGGRGLDARVEGSIADIVAISGADLAVAVTLENLDEASVEALSTLAKERGVRLPPALLAARAEIKGRVRGGPDNLELRELTAAIRDQGMSVEASGNVADLLGEPRVEAEGSANVDSLDTLTRYTGNELPATEPLSLRASLGGGENGGTPFRLDLAAGAVEATVEGDLGAVRSLDDMQLAFTASADSLADFSALARRELPANGPFRLSGRFEASQGAFALNDFNLKIDDQQASGSLTVTPGGDEGKVGSVDGSLVIGRLDLGPLVGLEVEAEAGDAPPEIAGAKPEAGNAKQVGDGPKRLFSTEPLPFDVLMQYAGDISISAENVTLGKTHFSNLDAVVTLADGQLTIDPLTSSVDDGKLTGRVVVDATSQPPAVTAFLDMKGAAMPRLGGNLELGVNVAGEGNSVAEIMAGLDGQALAVVKGAQIANSLLTSFGSDLLGSLNPLSKNKPYTELECGILRMEITDGIARFDDRLAAQLTETTWRGGGEINLKTEKLDVGIVPRARKGLGISFGSLASLVQVTGTLAQPAVRPDPTGLAKNYGRYVAAVSTGGLSLLAEGLRDRLKANADVCAEIREGTVFNLPENGTSKAGAKE